MSTPSIIVGRGNWGVKTGNLLGYSLVDSLYLPREFTCSRADNTATRVNRNGNIEVVNANVPRIDYFGGQASLLVEPSATNGIRNNSMFGASAPNTLPTYWSNAGSTLTRQSVATGTLNGIPYVDIRISGTATNTFHDVFWDASNVIAASVGQNWVASCYLQIIAQPNPPVNYSFAMREFNSSNVFLGVFQGAALSISTTSFNRFSFTRVLTQATVAFVHPSLFFTLVSGQYYDFTIRIGYPQMEQSSVATSVIPTTAAGPVTRNADTISLTGATNLIGQTEGTIYAEVDVRSISDLKAIIQLDNGTGDNRLLIQLSSPNTLTFFTTNAGIVSTIASGTITTGTHKIAASYSSGNVQIYMDGLFLASGTMANYPSLALSNVSIGSRIYGVGQGNFLNDRILAAEIYPTRLPNVAQPGVLSLQSLTAI